MGDSPDTAFEELRFRLRGGLSLLARCTAPEDVVVALAFARQHGMAVAVRGSGDSAAGQSFSEGDLVIDVRGMRDVDIDPERGVARVGAGASWAEVEAATGLTAEDLLAVQLVTPEGEIVRVEIGEGPKQLAALRGGGDFGVVTTLELRLRPLG